MNIQIVFSLLPVIWRADPRWWPALPPALPVAMAAPHSYWPSHKPKQKLRQETQGISHLFHFIPQIVFLRFLFAKIKTTSLKNQASWLPHLKKIILRYLNRLLDGFYLTCYASFLTGFKTPKHTNTHAKILFIVSHKKKAINADK